MTKSKKLIIFGLGDLAQIAHEYFTHDSDYEVVGFTVDKKYMPSPLNKLPLVTHPFETLQDIFSPADHQVYCAVVYGNMNRDRAAICQRVKDKGYRLASYVSRRTSVSPTAKIGEHAFIFEANVIQSSVEIGNNCILWSGNHIGHHSKIGNDVFISSHAVVSGHCEVGANCFIGVNATLHNNTVLGKESWVMPGAILKGIIPPNSLVKVPASEAQPLNEKALAWALERAKR